MNCDAFLDLVPFWQFKKLEKHSWRSVTFSTRFSKSTDGIKLRKGSHLELTGEFYKNMNLVLFLRVACLLEKVVNLDLILIHFVLASHLLLNLTNDELKRKMSSSWVSMNFFDQNFVSLAFILFPYMRQSIQERTK